jgi:hypothetical protein
VQNCCYSAELNSCFAAELHCFLLTEPCSAPCVFSLKKNCDVDCCLAPSYNWQVKRMYSGVGKGCRRKQKLAYEVPLKGVVVGVGATRRRSSRCGPKGASRPFSSARRWRGSPPFPVAVGAAELCRSGRAKFSHD